ncbi:MAG: acyl-CoA thioesterase [Deltaproteobacteria bacterium]|nr:acyl-CoA thioesterase [Deltaproteobacteria bacterium]
MEAKKVSESGMITVQQMTQQDANMAGNVHGGTIMKLIDNTAGIAAIRHAGRGCVTASIDKIVFYKPVYVFDLLRIKASVNFVGRTSIEVGARVEAEDYMTGEVRHTASAYITFVALDREGKPTLVLPLILETEEDKRRNKEAVMRREKRLKDRI